MKRVDAFTILETLITLTLVLFVFTIAGGLVTGYLRTSRFSAGVDRNLEAAQTALGRIRSEAGQAIRFTSPLPAGPAVSTLTFQKVVPLPSRLPDPTLPFPSSWDPHDPNWRATVTISLNQDQLVRSVVLGSTSTAPLARGIDSFSVGFLPSGNLGIQISTREGERVRTLTSELFLTTLR